MGLGMRWVVRFVAGLPCTTLWKGGAAGRRQLELEGEGGTMNWASLQLPSLIAWRHVADRGHRNGKGSTGAGAGGEML